MLTVKTLQSLRSDMNFCLFWEKVELMRVQLRNLYYQESVRFLDVTSKELAKLSFMLQLRICIGKCTLKLLTSL